MKPKIIANSSTLHDGLMRSNLGIEPFQLIIKDRRLKFPGGWEIIVDCKEDMEVELTMMQISKLMQILLIIEDQPIVIHIDDDNSNWIHLHLTI